MQRDQKGQRGSILLVVGLAVAATLVAWGAHALVHDMESQPRSGPQRVVSLSPAMTETLFAIGAGSQVVGVSDYTQSPRAALGLPRAGTAIAPDFESLVRLRPTLVVAQSTGGTRLDQLRAIADTRVLGWLSVDDVVRSTIQLGRLTGHQREATNLALKLQRRLSRPVPPDAPRVLLVLGYAGLGSQQLWFVKRNSIHGKALAAAGARNAIDRDVSGPPTLSPERLMLVDPDAIIVLASGDGESGLQPIRRLTQLSAVRHERLGVINDPAALIPGPRILTLVDKLEALTDSLEARR